MHVYFIIYFNFVALVTGDAALSSVTHGSLLKGNGVFLHLVLSFPMLNLLCARQKKKRICCDCLVVHSTRNVSNSDGKQRSESLNTRFSLFTYISYFVPNVILKRKKCYLIKINSYELKLTYYFKEFVEIVKN